MGWLTLGLTLPTHRLFLHHGDPRPVHLHIEDRNRFTDHHRQIQLHGTLDLLLLACGDMLPDKLRRPFHAFGGHLQIGEQFHLLASLVKGRRLAHERLHAPHSGREFRILNVQLDVGGKLAIMTAGAQVVGTRHFRVAYGGKDWLSTQFLVASLVAASARNGPLTGWRGWKLQQFREGCGARLMHGRAYGHLQGFQVQTPRLAERAEDHIQQSVYFARDFLLDRFGRFFSRAESVVSSSGRKAQICSLTSNSCSPNSRKRRHSETSRCALAKPAGEENVSVTVLPFTLRVSR